MRYTPTATIGAKVGYISDQTDSYMPRLWGWLIGTFALSLKSQFLGEFWSSSSEVNKEPLKNGVC